MHALLQLLAQTTTSKPKSGSSSSSVITLLFFVVIIGAVYVLFLRPRQQRMKQQQAARSDLAIGDPVLTAGGIHGRLVAIDDEVAEVEVAPGVVLTMLKRAVTARPGAAASASTGPVDEEWELPSRSDDHAGELANGADNAGRGTGSAQTDNHPPNESSVPPDGGAADVGHHEGGDSPDSPGETGETGETGSGDQNDRLS